MSGAHHGERGGKPTGWSPGKHGKFGGIAVPAVFKKQPTAVDAAVLQMQGIVGNAELIDEDLIEHKVLLYRLVSLNCEGPWGMGKLLDIEKQNPEDDALRTALHMLLKRPWRKDPMRLFQMGEDASVGEEFSDVVSMASVANSWGAQGVPVGLNASDEGPGGCEQMDCSHLGLQKLRRLKSLGCLQPRFSGMDPNESWGTVLAHGRGTVGETALHLLFLMNTPHHRRLIRLLVPWLGRQEVLDANGSTVSMLNASYLGQPYNGEVALHFAVIQQDLEMVKLLVENGASTKHLKGDRQGQNIHANGSFAYSNTDLYFGGTILGFAACLGNVDIVDYLMAQDTDVNARDQGPMCGKPKFPRMVMNNTVLHCCVLHSQAAMYHHLTEKYGANPWVMNDVGDTPLLLATACRSRRMVQVCMDGQKETLWKFGPVSSVRYPLYEIESNIRTDEGVLAHIKDFSQEALGKKQKGRRTVLQVIDRENAFELLYSYLLWRLVQDKWSHFARSIFVWFVFLNVASLIAQTLSQCTTIENEHCEGVLLVIWVPLPLPNMPSIIGDVACFVNLALTMWLLLARVFTQLRLDKPLKRDAIEILSCLLPWIGMPFRFSLSTLGTHRVILGFASACGWFRFLQEAFKFSSELGPLVLMVRKIMFNNVVPFVLVWLCFFTMFFSLLWGLYGGMLTNKPEEASELKVIDIVLLLIRYTINPDTEYFQELYDGEGQNILKGISAIVQTIWVLLSTIVLLNALIAMMNSTYAAIHNEQEGQWRLQFLEQVLFYEAMPGLYLPQCCGIFRKRRPANQTGGKLHVLTPAGERQVVDCWYIQLEYREGQDGHHGIWEAAEAEAQMAEVGIQPMSADKMEERLLELRRSMEASVDKTINAALAAVSQKIDQVLLQQRAGEPAEPLPASDPLAVFATAPLPRGAADHAHKTAKLETASKFDVMRSPAFSLPSADAPPSVRRFPSGAGAGCPAPQQQGEHEGGVGGKVGAVAAPGAQAHAAQNGAALRPISVKLPVSLAVDVIGRVKRLAAATGYGLRAIAGIAR
eukprot:CAMPEP_0181210514 /NCGR_PEP_ID=MMETSP1096-20121128/23269_1 /TAXON_ID=156174 ORGANISM="Chrysochromulina ericina, Strain CCMP281" /NCGR_SAMPLE_ID=MMETSP1096 /ASSEMBLY_ACC=CAM_ASM_000453 /LENGTH=1040 /DNA_ID=CAMNT_0023301805 /DNA_START=196 /DNA_END=3317 /DNA_ORIENTATION=+